jgi:hypothetical protein
MGCRYNVVLRRLANDPSFSTPTSTRSSDPSFVTQLPLTFTNPFFSVNEKLYHQVDRISKYFRNCAQQRDGTFRLDHLGELAYKDGRCDFYHQHASTLLEALRAVDLLKVVTANAAGNFVLTIDEASTSLPRQTLNEIMDNMMQNSYV